MKTAAPGPGPLPNIVTLWRQQTYALTLIDQLMTRDRTGLRAIRPGHLILTITGLDVQGSTLTAPRPHRNLQRTFTRRRRDHGTHIIDYWLEHFLDWRLWVTACTRTAGPRALRLRLTQLGLPGVDRSVSAADDRED